jgi:hypothetical protein
MNVTSYQTLLESQPSSAANTSNKYIVNYTTNPAAIASSFIETNSSSLSTLSTGNNWQYEIERALEDALYSSLREAVRSCEEEDSAVTYQLSSIEEDVTNAEVSILQHYAKASRARSDSNEETEEEAAAAAAAAKTSRGTPKIKNKLLQVLNTNYLTSTSSSSSPKEGARNRRLLLSSPKTSKNSEFFKDDNLNADEEQRIQDDDGSSHEELQVKQSAIKQAVHTSTNELTDLNATIDEFEARRRAEDSSAEWTMYAPTIHVSTDNDYNADADNEGGGRRISREEWRTWLEIETNKIEIANADRAAIIAENRRLRRGLRVPSKEEGEGRQCEQDDAIAALQEKISHARLLESELKTELHILETSSM